MAKKISVVKEVKVEPEVEVLPETPEYNGLIDRVYLIQKTGIDMLEGLDALGDIKAILEESKKGDDGEAPFTFYEDGRPVYIAVKNGTYSPLTFPEPGTNPTDKEPTDKEPKLDTIKRRIGITSMQLYSWAVTLAETIEKIIELETQPKPSLIDQARKIMTPTIVIVGSIVGVFLIVAMMGG